MNRCESIAVRWLIRRTSFNKQELQRRPSIRATTTTLERILFIAPILYHSPLRHHSRPKNVKLLIYFQHWTGGALVEDTHCVKLFSFKFNLQSVAEVSLPGDIILMSETLSRLCQLELRRSLVIRCAELLIFNNQVQGLPEPTGTGEDTLEELGRRCCCCWQSV